MQNAKYIMQNEKCETSAGLDRSARSGSRHSTLNPRPSRRGFTLIELLIVITIIAILAGLVIGVASVAGQTGRDAKTRNIVGRIHTLIMEHCNSYKNRRVEIDSAVEDLIRNTSAWTSAQKGQATAAARLYALREMMIMEIPDRWSDLTFDEASDPPVAPLYLAERTALWSNFYRRLSALLNRTNAITGSPNRLVEDILANQSAECLYMIVTVACGDGEARTLFHENDIGDVDGDGAQEFLDGWGHPISFLRWAPGFDSQIQGNANDLPDPPPEAPGENPTWEAAASLDHDPFDLFRIDPAAFRLQPVVVSAGRDEQLGLVTHEDVVVWSGATRPLVARTIAPYYPFFQWTIRPFQRIGSPPSSTYMGTALAEGATDNIHNHTTSRRLAVQR